MSTCARSCATNGSDRSHLCVTSGMCCDGCNFIPRLAVWRCTHQDPYRKQIMVMAVRSFAWRKFTTIGPRRCVWNSSCAAPPPAPPPPPVENGEKGCVAKDTKTCDGCACGPCVCTMDPYCCNTAWDELCVDECKNKCGGCGGVAQTPIPTPPPTCVCTTGACCDGCNFRQFRICAVMSRFVGVQATMQCGSRASGKQVLLYGFIVIATMKMHRRLYYFACVCSWLWVCSWAFYSCRDMRAPKNLRLLGIGKNGSFEMLFESWFRMSPVWHAIITSDCDVTKWSLQYETHQRKVQPDYRYVLFRTTFRPDWDDRG